MCLCRGCIRKQFSQLKFCPAAIPVQHRPASRCCRLPVQHCCCKEGARAHTKTAALSHSSQQQQHAQHQRSAESSIAHTYVVVPPPAAPPRCRLTAGSLRRTPSPSRPCTHCCIPRAWRRWLGACSHSSTPLRTPDPRRHRPCGCSRGTVRMGPSSTLSGVGAWRCPLSTL